MVLRFFLLYLKGERSKKKITVDSDSVLVIYTFFTVYFVFTQTCLRALWRDSDLREPPFYDNNAPGLLASPAVQAIIPTYRFYCDCVNITSWETYVYPDSPLIRFRASHITFQVWRPSPTTTRINETTFYSLVGQNAFTSITATQGGLVQLSPTSPSHSIITAKLGDVVGYYTNSNRRFWLTNWGIQLERNGNYSQNMVWYQKQSNVATTIRPVNNSYISIGSDGSINSFTNAAPMLRIYYSKLF